MKTQEYPAFFARFYDLIYHQLRDSVDHDFFLNEVKNCTGKILEIGVGTGRFFIESLNQGADIYGIDISNPMLDVLKSKIDEKEHHRVCNQDITDFNLEHKFDLIIAPFRVFMHIIKKEKQIQALNNVFKHLNHGGKFIYDVFIPDLKQLITGFDNHLDFEGEYEKGKKVKRFVTTKPDLINQLINITFKLEWDEGNTTNSGVWDTSLRFFFRYEMEHIIERSDFSKYSLLGDYYKNKLNQTSKEFIVECIK